MRKHAVWALVGFLAVTAAWISWQVIESRRMRIQITGPASTSFTGEYVISDSAGRSAEPVAFDGSPPMTLRLSGHKIMVTVDKPGGGELFVTGYSADSGSELTFGPGPGSATITVRRAGFPLVRSIGGVLLLLLILGGLLTWDTRRRRRATAA